MIDKILSSLSSAATSDFVYSSLSYFGSRRGGELPGSWFVEAIGDLGIEEGAIRQTLFRLERSGVLTSRRTGRVKWYRATPATEAIMAAGRERVSHPTESTWDGEWTLVHFRVGEADRDLRDRLRDVLLVEGFGSLGPGMYLHPRDQTIRLQSVAADLGLADRLNVFRGQHVAGANADAMVRELWDLKSIAAKYRAFQRRFGPIALEPASHWSPREAFGLRFAFMFEFFRITWSDPSLPAELLPDSWPFEEARRTADTLMRKLMDGAVRHGETVLQQVTGKDVPSARPASSGRRR